MDFNEAIKAHSEWKTRLRGAISAQSTLDAGAIAKDDACILGKWLHGESSGKYGQLKSHAHCVVKHAAFHSAASKVAHDINNKRFEEAAAMLGAGTSYSTASNEVVFAIAALKREANL